MPTPKIMDITLDGKRVLVTGGSSGIGAAIAEALSASGARVAINYLGDPDAANEIAKRIRGKDHQVLTVQADVANPTEVEAMFARLDDEWEGIDILVNSAGIDGPRAMAWEADLDTWRKVIDVNLFGAFYCARQALRRMVHQRHGVILNISSVHEIIGWSGYSAYTASKAGLGMLTQTLAQEAAPHGVRVLALAPGAVQTAINQAVWSDPASLADLLAKIPLQRMGTPEEIAQLAVVLVSPIGAYITGRTIFVDGGMTDYPDFSHGG